MSRTVDRWPAITRGRLFEFAERALDAARNETERMPAVRRHLPGLALRLSTANAAYAEMTAERVHSCEVSGSEQSACNVVVAAPQDCRIAPPPPLNEAVFTPRDFEMTLAGTRFRAFYSRDFDLWQLYDTAACVGLQWMREPKGYPPWEPAAPLRVFLHWFYSSRGMRLCHAGTLGKNGRGVLLVGGGGAGKSGTVIAGVLGGLQTVGDDYVLVDPCRNTVQAYPVFSTLKQDRAGVERLQLDLDSKRQLNWQGKYELSCRDLGSELTQSLEIEAILLPRISGAERTAIVPASKASAMLALAPSSLFQIPGERDSGVALFSDLVRRLPCFRVELGHDGREVANSIGSFLERPTG